MRIGQRKHAAMRIGNPDRAVRMLCHGGEVPDLLAGGFEALSTGSQQQDAAAVAHPQNAAAIAQQPLRACCRVAPVGTGAVPALSVEPAQPAIDGCPQAATAIAFDAEHHPVRHILAGHKVGEAAVGQAINAGIEIADPRAIVRSQRQRRHVVRCVGFALRCCLPGEVFAVELEQTEAGRQPQRTAIGLLDVPDIGRCTALDAPGGVVKLQ
ncbi:hypothetical protein NX08_010755 [Xanthomonas vasicola]|nr:hypothetical protein [Xanthomonas vasicola]AZR34879.1 hypothetical protein NX08_010755 [Xanthomonas vasicola]